MIHSTIQVDLDSLWTYDQYLNKRNVYPQCDPVYAEAVQDFLRLFEKYKVKATFFVIGKDVQNPEHGSFLRQIADKGHEIANHSMNHPMGFNSLSEDRIRQEITGAHAQIRKELSLEPVGFRAPGFSVNEKVLNVLESLGYIYDASLVPSYLFGGLMNLAHSILKRKPVSLDCTKACYGKAPRTVYHPDKDDISKAGKMKIKELPVSTSLGWGLPIHSSYVFIRGKNFLDNSLKAYCRKSMSLAYLFHGIDLVDIAKYGLKLPFFGSLAKRGALCEHIVRSLKQFTEPLTISRFMETEE